MHQGQVNHSLTSVRYLNQFGLASAPPEEGSERLRSHHLFADDSPIHSHLHQQQHKVSKNTTDLLLLLSFRPRPIALRTKTSLPSVPRLENSPAGPTLQWETQPTHAHRHRTPRALWYRKRRYRACSDCPRNCSWGSGSTSIPSSASVSFSPGMSLRLSQPPSTASVPQEPILWKRRPRGWREQREALRNVKSRCPSPPLPSHPRSCSHPHIEFPWL